MLRCVAETGKKKYSENYTTIKSSYFLLSAFAPVTHLETILGETFKLLAISFGEALARSFTEFMPKSFNCTALFCQYL